MATGLRQLFIDSVKVIYWTGKALTKALPKMAKKATAADLRSALTDQLEVTQEQVARLEAVFSSIGEIARAKKCEGMDGVIKEANEIIDSGKAGVARDAGIILAGQKLSTVARASINIDAAAEDEGTTTSED